jgi:hypothetical protein
VKSLKTIVAAVLVASFSSFAGADLMIGGGLNLSNLSYSEDLGSGVTKSMRVGFNAGANLFIPFSEQIGLTPGVNFETRGTKIESSYQSNKLTMTMSMNYLQIPVLFTYKPMPELALKVGPELGIFLGGTEKDESNIAMLNGEGDITSDMVNTIDFGLSFGASYTIANMIAIGAGYYLGLTNVNKSASADAEASEESASPSGDFKNNNIKIYVAYVIHF